MTTANDDSPTIKIANMDAALKAAIGRWHDRAYKLLVTLKASGYLLNEIQQDGTRSEDGRLDSALEIVEQCIANIESLDDEIASGAYGHVVEPPAGKSGETHAATSDLKVDWDERVVIVHKGHVCVASGELEKQIKRSVARMDEQPAAA